MLMIGGALGGLEATVFPHVGAGFWPLVGLAGVLGGVMRSPLTGVVFALELTHRYEALLPLLIGATVAYAVSILVLRRSVLTEKIARRGLHLTREYSVDPLEVLFVGDVMSTAVEPVAQAPPEAVVAHADDTLRHVAYVMAEHGVTELPVVDRDDHGRGASARSRWSSSSQGRLRDLHEERHSERVLRPARPDRARPRRRRRGDRRLAMPSMSQRRLREAARLSLGPAPLPALERGAGPRAGLTPAQHQLLLAVKGHPGAVGADDRRDRRVPRPPHHSVVELIDRAVKPGLVERGRDAGRPPGHPTCC